MLGHAHYILRMTDPDRVFSSMSEEIKIKIFVVYSHKIQKVPAHSITTTCSTLKKSTLFFGPHNLRNPKENQVPGSCTIWIYAVI